MKQCLRGASFLCYVSVCVCVCVCVCVQHLKLQTSLTEYPRVVEFYLLDPSRATGSCECEKLVMFPPSVRCLDTQQFSNMPAPTFSSIISTGGLQPHFLPPGQRAHPIAPSPGHPPDTRVGVQSPLHGPSAPSSPPQLELPPFRAALLLSLVPLGFPLPRPSFSHHTLQE